MPYTKKQAEAIARQIHERFGARIDIATQGTLVPPEFVAGLIGVEAGKDAKGNIRENASRYEAGVFRKLAQVRDGLRKSWSHITKKDIIDSGDEALTALATSYGLTQVMGWHCIHNLDCKIADLRGPDHLKYAVKLLMMNAADGDFERKQYVGEFKEWNTGSETGKTYHADYVANAGAVMDAYWALGPVELSVTEPVTEAITEVRPEGPVSVTAPSPAQIDTTIPAIPPLVSHVPSWAKKIVGWGAGINLVGLGSAFAFFRDNPQALAAALTIIKWTLLGVGVVVALIVAGVFIGKLYYAKLANDLNMERLRHFSTPGTPNVDFSGWKGQGEVKS